MSTPEQAGGHPTLAAVLRERDRPYSLEEIRLDPLRPDEVLVRVVAAGMCHTDLRRRDAPEPYAPIVLGHEGAGVVEEVGAAVTSVTVGDHVLMSYDTCGRCASCHAGAPSSCGEMDARNLTGLRVDGSTGASDARGERLASRWFGQSSFAQYAVARERSVIVVDRDLPLATLAPLGCGIQTGAGTVFHEMGLRPGQSLAVFGTGAVGLAAVMAARIAGASDIVAIDLDDARLELARELGATRAVNSRDQDAVAAVLDGGAPVDFSLDTTGVPEVVVAALSVLARPGSCVMVASRGELRLPPQLLMRRRLTFAIEGSSVPALLIPQLIRHWQEGQLPLERLIRTYPLAEIDRAEADALSGRTIKPVLLP